MYILLFIVLVSFKLLGPDPNVRKDLRRWLREIHDELGITTLFVTHDQEEALDLADRMVILKQGNIELLGTPYNVCNNPQSAFVMKFLGDTHILQVKIQNGYAKLDNLNLDASGLPNGDAQLFHRPDDLSWGGEVGQGDNALSVTVTKIMDRPGRRRLVVKTNDEHVLELDVPEETTINEKHQGLVVIKRTQFFAI